MHVPKLTFYLSDTLSQHIECSFWPEYFNLGGITINGSCCTTEAQVGVEHGVDTVNPPGLVSLYVCSALH